MSSSTASRWSSTAATPARCPAASFAGDIRQRLPADRSAADRGGRAGRRAARVRANEPKSTELDDDSARPPASVLGLGRFGGRMADHVHADGVNVLGIDFDPESVARAARREINAIQGDAEDSELIGHLPLDCVEWVISSSPDADSNIVLFQALRANGYRGRIALTTNGALAAERLENAGADRILRPFADAADVACRALGFAPVAPPP